MLADIDALTATELLDIATVARPLASAGPRASTARSARAGYRLLAKVPRLPGAVVERLVDHFGTLQKLLAASIDDLQAVDGVGDSTRPLRARGPLPPGRVVHPRTLRLTRCPARVGVCLVFYAPGL